MKAAVFTLCTLVTASLQANDFSYTDKEFCELNKNKVSILDKQYIKAYRKKLGFRPTSNHCYQLLNKNVTESSTTKPWSYFMSTPYKGSVIKLSRTQVKKLKSMELDQIKVY